MGVGDDDIPKIIQEPVESLIIIRFATEDGQEGLGDIWFGHFKESALPKDMPGVHSADQPKGYRCIIQKGNQYNRVKISVYEKFFDCLAGVDIEDVRSIWIMGYLVTNANNDVAELYMDNVKLYYAD